MISYIMTLNPLPLPSSSFSTPNIQTVRGETPLHLATRANQADIIRVLLRHGGDANAQAREQTTPLHIASRIGNRDIVALLLQHGAKADAVTKVIKVESCKDRT